MSDPALESLLRKWRRRRRKRQQRPDPVAMSERLMAGRRFESFPLEPAPRLMALPAPTPIAGVSTVAPLGNETPKKGTKMSADPKKVLLTTLQLRTNSRGNEYLVGRLGSARVDGARGEPMPDGTPIFDIFIFADPLPVGRPRKRRAAKADGKRTAVERWKPKSPAEFDPGRPFFDDDISDLGGSA